MNQLSPSRVNPSRFVAILFVAALVSCIDLFNDPEVAGSASDEQTKTLMGTVIDVDNKPVQGVEAELSVKELRCTTDEKGVFRFSVKENHVALAKAASGTVLDTLTLSLDGQRFYLELVTQWDTTFSPVVMASKNISGSVPANLPDIQELAADFNPAAPASKLNAEIGLTLNRETGEFSGKVYYAVELPEQSFILDISAIGWNGEIVFSNLKFTFTHQTPLVQKGRIQYPSPDTVCDTCGQSGFFTITALNDSGLQPLTGFSIDIHTEDFSIDINTEDTSWLMRDYTMITDTNGMVSVPYTQVPLTVMVFARECYGGDTLFISESEQNMNYNILFDCQNPVQEPVCDTCGQSGFFTITALNGSGLQPLTGFPIDIHTEDTSLLMRNYTMITDTNGMVSVPYTQVPLTVIVYSRECDAGDTLFISGTEQNMNHNILFDCQNPAQDSLCDTCDLPASFFITALNSDSLPLAGAHVTLLLHSTSGQDIKYGSRADANGRVEARHIPGLMNVVGIISGCGADTLFISDVEKKMNYQFMFDCLSPDSETVCDTCDLPDSYIISVISNSDTLPLSGVLMEIHFPDTNGQVGTDTMITGGNGSITIPYFPGPFSVTARHPEFRADSLTFSGLEKKGNHFLLLSKLPEICFEVGAPGTCKAAFPGYYYNQSMGGCVEFVWGGCDGNRPFSTLDSCQSICK